jgi:hypothetical protein
MRGHNDIVGMRFCASALATIDLASDDVVFSVVEACLPLPHCWDSTRFSPELDNLFEESYDLSDTLLEYIPNFIPNYLG